MLENISTFQFQSIIIRERPCRTARRSLCWCHFILKCFCKYTWLGQKYSYNSEANKTLFCTTWQNRTNNNVTRHFQKKCYTSWSISRWYLKNYKKIVCAVCIQKSLLAHQRSMMLGPNRKHKQVTNLDNMLRISKQAVGHSVAQLKS